MRATAILIAVLVAAPLTAEAKPTKASKVKAHMNRAAKAHKAKNFEVALTELEAAYAIDPQAKLLFAIAQVQAKLDRCEGAIENYEKFLASTKDKQQKSIVKQAIAACKTKLAAAEPPPPPEPPPAEPPPVEPAPIAPAPAPAPAPIVDDTPPPESAPFAAPAETPPQGNRPFYGDVVGDALVVGGLAAGVASVVMYVKATGALDDAENAPSLDQYVDGVARAHDHRTYSVIFAGTGVVLVAGGILRFAFHDRGETRRVAVMPTAGGGLVTWSGGF